MRLQRRAVRLAPNAGAMIIQYGELYRRLASLSMETVAATGPVQITIYTGPIACASRSVTPERGRVDPLLWAAALSEIAITLFVLRQIH